MRELIREYLPRSVIKIFSLTATTTLVKMLTGFVALKIIAQVVGTEGVAMLGQLNNFTSIILILACGGINNGVTKYVSEYKQMPEKANDYIRSAFQITVVFSSVCALILLLFSEIFGEAILLDKNLQYVFVFFSATIILYALNTLFSSIVNGLQDYKNYVLINISNSIVGLIFTITLVWFWKIPGLLIGAVTYQSVVIIFTVINIYRQLWFTEIKFKFRINKSIWSEYSKYSLMTFTTAATVPVSQLIIRSIIVKKLSTTEAGLWEGMSRISGAYLSVFITSFSVYYLPRLSELQGKKLIRKEIINAYRLTLPVLAAIFIIIYLLRFQVINLLFTGDFLEMQTLFFWQLLGDLLKISGWIIAFVMIAKAHSKIFIITETLFSLLYVVISYLLIDSYQLIGVMIAYLVMYTLYLIFMIYFFRRTYC